MEGGGSAMEEGMVSGGSAMETKNIYEDLAKMRYDTSIEKRGYIILRRHQIIPKYYLLSTDINTLILNYSTGSGKTLTGLFIVLNRLYLTKISQFVNPSLAKRLNKAVIVGEWITQNQFSNEIGRPIFDFKNEKPKRLVEFYGYQALFISLFPYYYEHKTQDVEILLHDYNSGKLQVQQSFVEKLRDTIMVVDEMQNLYSKQGLNTYGFTLAYLARIAKEINLKIVLMTGTVFNSSLKEISCVLNLISQQKSFYDFEEFCDKEEAESGIEVYKLKPSKMKEIINLFDNKFIYFSTSRETKVYEDISKIKKSFAYSNEISNVKFYKAKSPYFPDEYKLGNTEINDDMNVFQLELQGLQAKTFAETKQKYDEDDDNTLSVYDAVLPPNGVSKGSDGLYEGDFLLAKNLINYSRIGYEIVNLCLYNSFQNEKTVIYHNKVRNFGLLQYAKILDVNGFVKYGSEPKRYSICRLCRKTLEKHPKSCPHFTPIFYHYLYGLQKERERKFVVNQIYNSPNNLYGDLISVLLISDVAYSGVSLLNTNNLAIISRVSSISKIEQIQSRIRRMKSHVSLPKERRVVKFFIYGVCSPHVAKNKTEIYKYYKTASESNIYIQKFIQKLIPETVGYRLFHEPEKLKLTPKEIEKTSKLFFDDGKLALPKAINYLFKNTAISSWELENLISRIKSREFSLSWIDLSIFPDSLIRALIFQEPKVKLFTYKSLQDKVFVRSRKLKKSEDRIANSIKFKEVSADYGKSIARYLADMEREPSIIKKSIYFVRLMNLLYELNDYSTLVESKYIWKLAYMLHDEYYDNDETDFIKNHASKNRNVEKLRGLYWHNKIILNNGKTKTIDYTFGEASLYPNTMFSFRVVSTTGLHLVVYNYSRMPKDSDDFRFRIRGNDCWSYRENDFLMTFKFSKSDKNSMDFCAKLLSQLCEEQLKSETTFILTPFQR